MKSSFSRWMSIAAVTVAAAVAFTPSAMAAPVDAAQAPAATVKITVQHSGKCVTDGYAYNQPATQYVCGQERDYAQRWTFQEAHPGYYTIAGTSGLCLTSPAGGGMVVTMLNCSPYPETINQHFMLRYKTIGWYQLVSEYSGLCLTVPGSSPLDGTSLIQAPCSSPGTSNQLFGFTAV
ncbi:hypothetical protein D5S17_31740 [Pseudonocardiaceae bacterium YIM PH 21723]|nr:hypothetical protein D5S17_31740 [Pseudonocardiaceae bacterium YIM PH 21723]